MKYSSVQRTQWMGRWDRELCWGLHRTSHYILHIPLGTSGWMDIWMQYCVEGHHRTSLDVPYVPWGLRDGMDRWDRELC